MTMGMFFWVKKVVPALIVAADGSGDFTSIQAAIDALPATGGQVFVKEGTYTITSNIEINKPDVLISGAGWCTKLETTASIIVFRIGNVTSSSRVTIRDLLITGDGSANQYGIVWIDGIDGKVINCKVDGVGANGVNIELIDSSGNYLIDNTLVNCGGWGLVISQANECIIRDNIIQDNTEAGVAISRFLGTSDRNLIQGNIITGNDVGVSVSAGNTGNIIIGNTISGNTTADIDDEGTDTQIGHNVTT